MLSELPVGERLALKGQLFELSKKLSLIELENQTKEDFSFVPQINEYALPDRDPNNFEANMRRAELIKQQKMEMLKATLTSVNDAACTFSPQISKRSQRLVDQAYVSKPVEERLHEKALESRKSKEDLIEKSKKFDANGNRLFSPRIAKAPSSSSSSASSTTPKGNSITVGEYMYRDAVDREERHKMRAVAAKAEAELGSSSFRNNKMSEKILRRKAEREVRAVFEVLDSGGTGVLTYQDLQSGVEIMCDKGKLARDLLYKTTEQAWSILDKDEADSVQFSAFLAKCVPFMLRETWTGSWAADNALPRVNSGLVLSDASLSFQQPPVNAVPKNEALAALRSIVRSLIEILQSDPALVGGSKSPTLQSCFRLKHTQREEESTPFSPVINKSSRKMALENRKVLIKKFVVGEGQDAGAATSSSTTTTAPLDSTLSTVFSNLSTPSTVDVMALRIRQKEEKFRAVKEAEEERFRSSHTFKPVLNKRRPLKDPAVSTFKRVPYQKRDSEEKLMEEMKECTFKPSIPTYVRPEPIAEEDIAPGYVEAVARLWSYRAGLLSEPERIKLEVENNEKRYREARAKLVAGLKPPSFLTDERLQHKKEREARRVKPRLFVDVRLSPMKMASIPILDGDNPATIAKSFCKIYGLDQSARKVLEEVVRQSMEVNSVNISEDVQPGPSPIKLSAKRNVIRRSNAGVGLARGSGSSSGSDSSSASGSSGDSDGSSYDDDDEESSDSESEEVLQQR
jgi:hypothetical protein